MKGLSSADAMQLDPDADLQRIPPRDLREAALAGGLPFLFASLKVSISISWWGPSWVNCPRARRRAWRAPSFGQLLWADGADLVGAVHGGHSRGPVAGAGEPSGAPHVQGDGRPVMTAPPGTPSRIVLTGLAGMGVAFIAVFLAHGGGGMLLWLCALAAWLLLWLANQHWSTLPERAPTLLARGGGIGIPFLFGFSLLFLWEVICVGLKVPTVLLPPPSMIGARIAGSLPTLGADFVQTVIRAVIPGWIMGSLAGFLIALLCDRFGFLRRGLMPIGNFISALPIIGIAPILVMWFGFDWQSKAAVVVVMTFFPCW